MATGWISRLPLLSELFEGKWGVPRANFPEQHLRAQYVTENVLRVFAYPPEHDPGGEYAILIGERACAAGLFGNVAHGADADAVSLSLGRAEDTVFLSDLAVKGVLDFD